MAVLRRPLLFGGESSYLHIHPGIQADMHDLSTMDEQLEVGLIAVAKKINHPAAIFIKVAFLHG